jgi:hypothetical protein
MTKMNNTFCSVSRNTPLRPPPTWRLRGLPVMVFSAGYCSSYARAKAGSNALNSLEVNPVSATHFLRLRLS